MTELSKEQLENLIQSISFHAKEHGHLADFNAGNREELASKMRDMLQDEDTKFIINTSNCPEKGGAIIFFNESSKSFLVFNPNMLEKGDFAGTFYRAPKLNAGGQPTNTDGSKVLTESQENKRFKEQLKNVKNQIVREGGAVDRKSIQEHKINENDIWKKAIKDNESLIKYTLDNSAKITTNLRINDILVKGDLKTMQGIDENIAHVLDESTNSVITINQATGDRTLVQFDTLEAAQKKMGEYIGEIGRSTGKWPKLIEGGIDALNDAIRAGNSFFGKVADITGDTLKFLGKASKVLGPIGVAAASAEAAELGGKMRDAVQYGLISEDAAMAYDAMLAAHVAQATIDPSLVGGEVAIQQAFEEWADAYNIPAYVKEELEPGSLIEMITGDIRLGQDAELSDIKENLPRELPLDAPPEVHALANALNRIDAIRDREYKGGSARMFNKNKNEDLRAARQYLEDLYEEMREHGGLEHVTEYLAELETESQDESPAPYEPEIADTGPLHRPILSVLER